MNCVRNAPIRVQIRVPDQHWPLPSAIDCRNNDCTIRHMRAGWFVSSFRSIVAADSTMSMDRMHRTPRAVSDDSSRCHRRQWNSYRHVHCHCRDHVYVLDHVYQQLPAAHFLTCYHTRSSQIRNNGRHDYDSVHLEVKESVLFDKSKPGINRRNPPGCGRPSRSSLSRSFLYCRSGRSSR